MSASYYKHVYYINTLLKIIRYYYNIYYYKYIYNYFYSYLFLYLVYSPKIAITNSNFYSNTIFYSLIKLYRYFIYIKNYTTKIIS